MFPLAKMRKVPPLLPVTASPTTPGPALVAVPSIILTPVTVNSPPLGSLSGVTELPSNTFTPEIVEFSKVVKSSSTAVGAALVTAIANSLVVKPVVLLARTMIECDCASSKLINDPSATVTTPEVSSIVKRPPALSSRV